MNPIITVFGVLDSGLGGEHYLEGRYLYTKKQQMVCPAQIEKDRGDPTCQWVLDHRRGGEREYYQDLRKISSEIYVV